MEGIGSRVSIIEVGCECDESILAERLKSPLRGSGSGVMTCERVRGRGLFPEVISSLEEAERKKGLGAIIQVFCGS